MEEITYLLEQDSKSEEEFVSDGKSPAESGALNLGYGALLLFNLFFIFQTTHNYDVRECPQRHSGPFLAKVCLLNRLNLWVPLSLFIYWEIMNLIVTMIYKINILFFLIYLL